MHFKTEILKHQVPCSNTHHLPILSGIHKTNTKYRAPHNILRLRQDHATELTERNISLLWLRQDNAT